ncbi:MAG: hypothetical protein SGI88_03690 [Candidatus Hydrogenedentes bacterium]|nr:hypothetical protein [Candidatus Hydrogenedentota bacterium]
MLRTGEIYRCPNDECGCEIEVIEGAKQGGDQAPRCCCGMAMERLEGEEMDADEEDLLP